MAAMVLLVASTAYGQYSRPPSGNPARQPPPPPERVYPGAADRALDPPDVLRDDRIDPDHGVVIGLGPHSVSLHSPRLKIDDGPTLNPAEGVVISADVLFGNFRIGYARQFYRRSLPVGSTFAGERVTFLSVDGDQILATVGWRPWYGVYLGAIGGVEYRLIRLRNEMDNVINNTETTGVVGAVVDLQVALPFTFQLRLLRETADKIVRMDSTVLQLTYIIPF
ncbi:MAG TPA: hypothetical protein VF678_07485 [bacterium]